VHSRFFVRRVGDIPFKIDGYDVKQGVDVRCTSRSKRENALSMKENFVILFFKPFCIQTGECWRDKRWLLAYACEKKNTRHDFICSFPNSSSITKTKLCHSPILLFDNRHELIFLTKLIFQMLSSSAFLIF
jgi:hypothetical protein